MPILKTIMLKWASSGTDMERPWRPLVEARLPGALLPRPRVPWGPLPGPSGELSDSEPPSGHSLALWCSSSSLVAGLWVIVGPRGNGGQQHHRQLGKARVILAKEPFRGSPSATQWTDTVAACSLCPRRLDIPSASCTEKLTPPLQPPGTFLLPVLGPACSPHPPALHFVADPVCPRNHRITAGSTGPLCQATENEAKIS